MGRKSKAKVDAVDDSFVREGSFSGETVTKRKNARPAQQLKKMTFVLFPLIFLAALFFYVSQPDAFHSTVAPSLVYLTTSTGEKIWIPSEDYQANALLRARIAIETVEGLAARGVLPESAAKAEIDSLMLAASTKCAHTVTRADVNLVSLDELLASTRHGGIVAGVWTRFKGILSLTNALIAVAIIILVIAFHRILVIFLYPVVKVMKVVWSILINTPLVVYEGLAYVLEFGLIVLGGALSNDFGFWLVFAAAALLPVVFFLTGVAHKTGNGDKEKFAEALFLFLTLAWAPLAAFYESRLLGTLAVLAFGFLVAFTHVLHESYSKTDLRRHEEQLVIILTQSAFICTALFTGCQIATTRFEWLDELVYPFLKPGLVLAPITLQLSWLFVCLTFRNTRLSYYIGSLATVLVSFGVGSVFNIPELVGSGGTFAVVHLFVYWIMLPWTSTTGPTIGLLGAGALLLGAGFVMRAYPALVIGLW